MSSVTQVEKSLSPSCFMIPISFWNLWMIVVKLVSRCPLYLVSCPFKITRAFSAWPPCARPRYDFNVFLLSVIPAMGFSVERDFNKVRPASGYWSYSSCRIRCWWHIICCDRFWNVIVIPFYSVQWKCAYLKKICMHLSGASWNHGCTRTYQRQRRSSESVWDPPRHRNVQEDPGAWHQDIALVLLEFGEISSWHFTGNL